MYFIYEGEKVPYEIVKKKMKYIRLRVKETGEVVASAPKSVRKEEIQRFVEEKKIWIVENRRKILKKKENLPSKEVYNGKIVYFLGQAYRLCIQPSDKNNVVLEETTIQILTKAKDAPETWKLQYLEFLRKEAKIIFQQLLEEAIEKVEKYGIPLPTMTVRNMKRIWGSCSYGKGSIRLNLQLVKKPIPCIEEVIFHELAHFKEPNHSKAFYELLEEWLPDFRERKRQLDTFPLDGV